MDVSNFKCVTYERMILFRQTNECSKKRMTIRSYDGSITYADKIINKKLCITELRLNYDYLECFCVCGNTFIMSIFQFVDIRN